MDEQKKRKNINKIVKCGAIVVLIIWAFALCIQQFFLIRQQINLMQLHRYSLAGENEKIRRSEINNRL